MSSFACYWPWLFGGLIGGWLLWQLFDKFFRRDGEAAGMRVRRDLEMANSRVGSLQGELAASREQLGLLRTDVDTSKAAVQAHAETVTRLEGELADWKAKYAALEASGAEQATKLETTAAAAAATAAAALAGATAKAASLSSELDDAKAAIAAHLATQKSLQADLDACKATSASLRQDLDGATATITGHVTTIEGLRADLDAAKASVAGHVKTQDGLRAELDAAKASLTAAQGDLRAARTTIEGHAARIASLDGDLGQQRTLADSLRRDLDACMARRSAMEAEMAQAAASAASARAFASAAEHGFTPRRGTRDDLLIIEGIGPKINELLVTAGIDTFAKLAAAPVTDVQAILDKAGPNFRLANPASWARQAAMCEAGDWAALRAYQDSLRAGVEAGKAAPRMTEEQILAAAKEYGFVPRRFGKDDLIIVEGIGPKINELLVANGIDTFAKLAAAPVAAVQAILDKAGPNFRLANPASWAQQAAMCEAGQWAALRTLQDSLRAGVDTTRGDA